MNLSREYGTLLAELDNLKTIIGTIQ